MMGHIREVRRRIKSHNVVVASAGVAFYGLLALVPTLIALVSIYGLVADPADIERQVDEIAGSLDGSTQELLRDQLEDIVGTVEDEQEAIANGGGGGGTSLVGRWSGLVIGIVLALWSSSGAVQKLIGTVAVAYEVEEHRPGWKLRAMAYLFTAGAIIGVGMMTMVIAVVPNVLSRVDLGGVAENLIQFGRFPTLAVVFAGALTILYRYGPDRSPKTPWRNPGAVVATSLFVIFAIAFSLYSANVGSMPASYGLLGSIAALMIFLQLTTVSVIAGAEVNSIVEGVEADRLATERRLAEAEAAGRPGDTSAEIGFVKAVAGLVALFVLGRGGDS